MRGKLGDIEIDELIARGLYDPETTDAQERLFLLEYVIRSGATIDEIVAAGSDLRALGAQRNLRGEPPGYTLAEAAGTAGVPLDVALRVNRASGFPDPDPSARVFTEEDVEVFGIIKVGSEFFGEELMIQFSRVFGLAMSRVADALISAFALNVGEQNQATRLDAADLAQANDTAIGLIPSAVRAMEVLLHRHMAAKSRRQILFDGEWEGVDALDRAVGFCDLVGYTSLSERLPTRELATFLADFEGRAADLVVGHGGSVVKLIGDEVMFVAPDAATSCSVAFALVATFKESDLPVRVGLASGRVLLREGDYYGPVVNLAARLVKLAPPGGVLAPAIFRELIPGADFEDAGNPELKGLDEPVELVVIRQS